MYNKAQINWPLTVRYTQLPLSLACSPVSSSSITTEHSYQPSSYVRRSLISIDAGSISLTRPWQQSAASCRTRQNFHFVTAVFELSKIAPWVYPQTLRYAGIGLKQPRSHNFASNAVRLVGDPYLYSTLYILREDYDRIATEAGGQGRWGQNISCKCHGHLPPAS